MLRYRIVDIFLTQGYVAILLLTTDTKHWFKGIKARKLGHGVAVPVYNFSCIYTRIGVFCIV